MLLDKYLPRIDFDSYEDFKANYRVNVPADFNFGFDIVDEWAKQEPEKKALVWCDDEGGDRTFTFTDISLLSNKAANAACPIRQPTTSQALASGKALL